MLKTARNSLTDKKGFSYIQWCILIVALCIIMSFVLNYVLAVNIVTGQREIAKQILDQRLTQNAIQIYEEIKGHSNYTETVLQDEFTTDLVEFCDLIPYETTHYESKTNDGNTRYVITAPQLSFEEDYTPKIILTYTISVPLEFNNLSVTWVDIPVTIVSRFVPKYDIDG